jgi:ribosomal protein L29
MKIKEIRDTKTEQLEKELDKFERELLVAKKDIRDGKEKNVRKGLRIKRNIARIQTVLNERSKNEKGD